MLQPDRQRLEHIRDYCIEIKKTIIRYGESFEAFDSDADYQRSVSFCIVVASGGCKVNLEFAILCIKRIERQQRNVRLRFYSNLTFDNFISETEIVKEQKVLHYRQM